MNLDTLIREVNPAPAETVPGPDSFEARAILEHLRIESSPRRRRPVLADGELPQLEGGLGPSGRPLDLDPQ